MKMTKFFLILLLPVSSICNAQSVTDSLEIKCSINNEYIIGDVIRVDYKNHTNTPLYVGLALERIDNDGNWILYFKDVFGKYIFTKNTDDDTIINILPESTGWTKESYFAIENTRSDTWTVANCLYENETQAMFRLKHVVAVIPYGFKANDKSVPLPSTVHFSKPFLVKKSKDVKNVIATMYHTYVAW